MINKITLESGLTFELNRNDLTASIIYSPKARGYINIPRTIRYKEEEFIITSIQKGSFKSNRKIKSITFTDDSSLLSIEKNAFKFSKIESLSLPSSVNDLQEGWCNQTPKLTSVSISPKNPNYKYIDNEHQIIVKKSDTTSDIFDVIIFANRNIRKAIIPSSIKRIESYSFDKCKKLEVIEIPENSELRSIGKKSFSFTEIKRLFIPSKFDQLSEGWCDYTYNLNDVEISPNNPNFKYIDEAHQILATKSDKETENFDDIIFVNRNIRCATIPESVKIIGPSSFDGCGKLRFIEIPENSQLEKICKNSFRNTQFKSIFIPSKVEEIHEKCFYYNYYLKNITLSSQNPNFKYLDETKQIILGKSDNKNQNYDVIIWSNKEIEKVKIPSSIKHIYPFSFMYCEKLKKIEFEENSQLQKIGINAFYLSSLKEITIPKSVTTIGRSAFDSCKSLERFKLEEGTKLLEIPDRMFIFSEKLTEIEIPEDSIIRSIGTYSFGETHIKSLYIPASVEEMKEGWCFWTSDLNSVILSPNNKNFKYLDENRQIIVERSDSNNDTFDSIIFANRNITEIAIPKFIKEIKANAFSDCSNLVNIFIPEDSELRSFGNASFSDTEIKRLFIPSKVEELKKSWCDSLPDNLKIEISPENENFKYLDEDEYIIVGKSDQRTENFDEIIFANKEIYEAFIPESIKHISQNAFKRCRNLKTIKFAENSQLKSIGKYAFSGSSITKFELPKEVEKIGLSAFSSCNKLISFKILKDSKLNEISDDLFIFSYHLESIEIPDDTKIKLINRDSFTFSSIKSLHISSNVEDIRECWCQDTESLIDVSISPKNRFFKFLDDKHQIIVQKSDKNNFDILFFANRNIKEAFIPNSINLISPSAFNGCKKLTKIVFQENSKLQSIESKTFKSSEIKSIIIPKSVYMIFSDSFSNCRSLESFEFLGDRILNDFISFENCSNLKIVSFPNVQKLNIDIDTSNSYSLFVSAKIKIEIHK